MERLRPISGPSTTSSLMVSESTLNGSDLAALGIADEVEQLGLKGSKKKKSRQLDEDWIVSLQVWSWLTVKPTLRPIATEQEVQKVAAAIRQSSENTKMMGRLLERVNVSPPEDFADM